MVAICLATFALGTGLVLAGNNPPSDYYINEEDLPFDALEGTDTTRYWGVHNGAGYRIEIPESWNGDLVLYAHGYRGTGPVLRVGNPSIRRYLVENGFAWAASSYRTNRYDVRAGVKDTHALGRFFNGMVGNPRRAYVMGHSMGGHVTAKIIEQYRNAYDGALPMCGVMADDELYDYFISYQLMAQALAGVEAEFPSPPNYLTEVVPAVKVALSDPIPSFPYNLNEQGLKLQAVTMYLSGGERPLFELSFQRWASFLLGLYFDDPTRGVAAGNMMENIDTVYQLDSDPALSEEEQELNDMVLRVEADPQGKHPNGIANIPPVAGDPTIPVLSLHTMGDIYVPLVMQQIYAQRLEENGKSDLGVFRVVRDTGHCGFALSEQEEAFADLVSWVEDGVEPAGDDILDPETVADPAFGCAFTRGQRDYDMPWPCSD
jgi:pimeloyl-ACP methyl ester carboxylesterase